MTTVVIDPGHGGTDCGAVNQSLGYLEKTVNFKVAMAMDKFIPDDYDLVYTRQTDVYVSLRTRCDLANAIDADLFVSLHANWFHDPLVRGLESFYCRGSRNGHKAAIAILNALVKKVEILNGNIDTINREEKPAGYYVLKHTKMPATLIELGFISNNWQAEFLMKEFNQAGMAEAIWKGIEVYFEAIG